MYVDENIATNKYKTSKYTTSKNLYILHYFYNRSTTENVQNKKLHRVTHKINFHQTVSLTKQNYDTKNRIKMIMGGKEVEDAGA